MEFICVILFLTGPKRSGDEELLCMNRPSGEFWCIIFCTLHDDIYGVTFKYVLPISMFHPNIEDWGPTMFSNSRMAMFMYHVVIDLGIPLHQALSDCLWLRLCQVPLLSSMDAYERSQLADALKANRF